MGLELGLGSGEEGVRLLRPCGEGGFVKEQPLQEDVVRVEDGVGVGAEGPPPQHLMRVKVEC